MADVSTIIGIVPNPTGTGAAQLGTKLTLVDSDIQGTANAKPPVDEGQPKLAFFVTSDGTLATKRTGGVPVTIAQGARVKLSGPVRGFNRGSGAWVTIPNTTTVDINYLAENASAGAPTTAAASMVALNDEVSRAAAVESDLQEQINAIGGPATVEAGDTNTLSPNAPANVTNVGTQRNAVFAFDIPRGATGAQGPPGTNAPIQVVTKTIDLTDATPQAVTGFPARYVPLFATFDNPSTDLSTVKPGLTLNVSASSGDDGVITSIDLSSLDGVITRGLTLAFGVGLYNPNTLTDDIAVTVEDPATAPATVQLGFVVLDLS